MGREKSTRKRSGSAHLSRLPICGARNAMSGYRLSRRIEQRVEKALTKLISRVECIFSQPSSLLSQSSRKQACILKKDTYITKKELKRGAWSASAGQGRRPQPQCLSKR